jgi:hypothetical protein
MRQLTVDSQGGDRSAVLRWTELLVPDDELSCLRFTGRSGARAPQAAGADRRTSEVIVS